MKPSFVRRSHKLYMHYVELKVRYHERMGNGTNDKIRLCAENSLPEPVFGYRDGFATTIWRPTSKNTGRNGEMPGEMPGKMPGKNLSKTEARIVQLMRDNPTVTLPEMSAATDRLERTIEKLVRKLKEEEIIGRVDPAKGGYWKVFE